MVMICYHYPFSSIFLSWDILFAGHQEVHPGLDDMFPLLVFAPACTDSPEKVSEFALVLKWVSQYLGQWRLPAGKALVDLVQEKSQIIDLEVDIYCSSLVLRLSPGNEAII